MSKNQSIPCSDDLTDEELLRYSRQVMIPAIDVEGQIKLKNAHVLIVGQGGLGSPVAMYLASAGVGHLTLVDFDNVDASNLQRQIIHREDTVGMPKVESAKRTIAQLNSHCQVTTVNQELSEELADVLIAQADVVVDASDNFLTRFMINRHVYNAGKVLVSGAAIRFEGQVTVFDFSHHSSPCYACLYQDIADEELSCSESGVIAPLVGIVGSVQALETIKVICGVGLPLIGRLLVLDTHTMEWRTMKFRKDPACQVCG